MKKLTYIFLFSLFSLTIIAQPYQYPICTRTKEWGKFQTESERIAALQLPDSVLKTINTRDLILTCLNYPAFGHFTAFNSIQEGFDFIFQNFNGLKELLARNDFGAEFLTLYKVLGKEGISNLPLNWFESDYLTIQLLWFEILGSQSIDKQLTQEEKTELIGISTRIYYEKLQSERYNSLPGILPTLLIIARIIEKENYYPNVPNSKIQLIKRFSDSSIIESFQLVEELLSIAKQYKQTYYELW